MVIKGGYIAKLSTVSLAMLMALPAPILRAQDPVPVRSTRTQRVFPPLPDMIARKQRLDERRANKGVLNKALTWIVESEPAEFEEALSPVRRLDRAAAWVVGADNAPPTYSQEPLIFEAPPGTGVAATPTSSALTPKSPNSSVILPAEFQAPPEAPATSVPSTGTESPIDDPMLKQISGTTDDVPGLPPIVEAAVPVLPDETKPSSSTDNRDPLMLPAKAEEPSPKPQLLPGLDSLQERSQNEALKRAEAGLKHMKTEPPASVAEPDVPYQPTMRHPGYRRDAAQHSKPPAKKTRAPATPVEEPPKDPGLRPLPSAEELSEASQKLEDAIRQLQPAPNSSVPPATSDTNPPSSDLVEARAELEKLAKQSSGDVLPVSASAVPEDPIAQARRELMERSQPEAQATVPSASQTATPPSVASDELTQASKELAELAAKGQLESVDTPSLDQARAELSALAKEKSDATSAPSAPVAVTAPPKPTLDRPANTAIVNALPTSPPQPKKEAPPEPALPVASPSKTLVDVPSSSETKKETPSKASEVVESKPLSQPGLSFAKEALSSSRPKEKVADPLPSTTSTLSPTPPPSVATAPDQQTPKAVVKKTSTAPNPSVPTPKPKPASNKTKPSAIAALPAPSPKVSTDKMNRASPVVTMPKIATDTPSLPSAPATAVSTPKVEPNQSAPVVVVPRVEPVQAPSPPPVTAPTAPPKTAHVEAPAPKPAAAPGPTSKADMGQKSQAAVSNSNPKLTPAAAQMNTVKHQMPTPKTANAPPNGDIAKFKPSAPEKELNKSDTRTAAPTQSQVRRLPAVMGVPTVVDGKAPVALSRPATVPTAPAPPVTKAASKSSAPVRMLPAREVTKNTNRPDAPPVTAPRRTAATETKRAAFDDPAQHPVPATASPAAAAKKPVEKTVTTHTVAKPAGVPLTSAQPSPPMAAPTSPQKTVTIPEAQPRSLPSIDAPEAPLPQPADVLASKEANVPAKQSEWTKATQTQTSPTAVGTEKTTTHAPTPLADTSLTSTTPPAPAAPALPKDVKPVPAPAATPPTASSAPAPIPAASVSLAPAVAAPSTLDQGMPITLPPAGTSPFNPHLARTYVRQLRNSTLPLEREIALSELARMRDWYRAADAVSTIIGVAQGSADPQTRFVAVTMLGSTPARTKEAATALRELAEHDPDPGVRQAARAHFISRGGQ